MTVELHLEDDEFDLLAAADWHCIGGYTHARQSLNEKMSEVFFQLHGANCHDVISSSVSRLRVSDWIDASVVAETIAEYHENKDEDDTDAPRVTFDYHGIERVVENPEFKGHLLGGVEIYRDGVRTEQYKNYLLSEITFF